MSKHARLSASKTKWWFGCAGGIAACEAYRPEPERSGHHAQMGTAAHKLSETCLRDGSDPDSYLDRVILIRELDGGDEEAVILKQGAKTPPNSATFFIVDQDMADAVGKHVSYVRRRCLELGLCGHEPAGLDLSVAGLVASGAVRLEQRVNPLPERDDTGGTGDVIIDAWPTLVEVVDYKNGSGVLVPAEGNMQTRSYGLGVLREPGGGDYERVRCTITQPRHYQAPPDGVMSEELTAAELVRWGDDLRMAASRVDDARSVVAACSDEHEALSELDRHGLLTVGDDGSHCEYCPLRLPCPASMRKAQELAAADFDDEPHELEAPSGDNSLTMFLPWVPFLESLCRTAMGLAERRLMSGGSLPGWKVVRKKSAGRKFRTHREVGDDMVEIGVEQLASELCSEFGLSRDDLFSAPELKSGPQVEKLIKKGDGRSAAERKKDFSDRYLYSPPGGLTIAPESDTRQAVQVDPASDFGDEPDFTTEE